MKKNIPLDKVFNWDPENFVTRYDGKILVIFPRIAKWIVLGNETQLGFFNILQGNTLCDALERFEGDIADAKHVITQIVGKAIEGSKPQSCINEDTKQLHFYLTNGCNLHCPHCYMFSGKKNVDELSTQEIINILSEFSLRGLNSVTFSGGEITVRPDLVVIVQHAHELGFRIRLLTNGVLWTDSLIAQIAPCIDAIQISIDGYSEESNAKIRGEHNFARSMRTVDGFIKKNVSTEIAITPPYSSAIDNEWKEYADFCRRLLNRYPSKIKIKISEQLIDGREIHITEEENIQYFKFINRIKSAINGWDSELESFVRSFNSDTIMDNCMYGVFAVDAIGNVFFCSRVSSLKPICNVRDTDIDKIFAMSKMAQKLSVIDNFRPCKYCELRYICGGGCRIDYFKEFTEIVDVNSVDFDKISPRTCSPSTKERFYRLMIASNNRLFK